MFLSDKLGIPVWLGEVIISVGIIIIAVIISRIVSLIIEKLRDRLDKSQIGGTFAVNPFKRLRRPLMFLMVLFGAAIALTRLKDVFDVKQTWVFEVVDGVIYCLGVLFIMILTIRIVNITLSWYARNIADKTETNIDDEFIPLVNRLMKIVIAIIGVMVALSHFDVDIKGLLAVLGVGSLAIALAAKDTLANMISGFIIMFDRPFREGDRVILPSGQTCDVYEIGLRSCKFLTFDNTIIVVPNESLIQATVVNVTYPDPAVRVVVNVGVAYGTDLDKAREVLLECAQSLDNVLESPAPDVKMLNFGDNSLDLSLRCRVATLGEKFTTECSLREIVYKSFNENNIEIPFPQRTVWIEKMPEKPAVEQVSV